MNYTSFHLDFSIRGTKSHSVKHYLWEKSKEGKRWLQSSSIRKKRWKNRIDSSLKCFSRPIFVCFSCELYSDVMLWYCEPPNLLGFVSVSSGHLAAGVFRVMLLLPSVCLIMATIGPPQNSSPAVPEATFTSYHRKTPATPQAVTRATSRALPTGNMQGILWW